MEECSNSLASLTVWELVCLNCIVCGLELVSSAAMVLLPSMLLESGFSEEYMSWILALGPFLCLFVVPIVGKWMDTCNSKYGRRIPFMFGFSILVLTALVLIPSTNHVTSPMSTSSVSHSTYVLAFGVILIDFASQAGLTPCEVFLQDVSKGLPIRDRAFGLYSLMCSLGSCAGYFTLAVNWTQTPIGLLFGDQESCVFSVLFVVFVLLMLINLRKATLIKAQQRMQPSRSYADLQSGYTNSVESDSPRDYPKNSTQLENLLNLTLPEGIRALLTIPYTLRRLVYANFFAWAGNMCFLLFFADYVGECVYHGKPSAELGTPRRILYDEGVRMGSLGLFLHAITSSLAAPVIEILVKEIGMKLLHLVNMAIFTSCVILILFIDNIVLVNGLAMLTGVGFASMTTIPFSLVGIYHEDIEGYYPDSTDRFSRGLGTDMATLDTAYFCSQVLLLSFMGYLTHVTGTAATYLITSATLSAISCYFIYTTVYNLTDVPDNVRLFTQEHLTNIAIPESNSQEDDLM